MSVPATMRPMSIGDLLDNAFRLYRKHFLTFIGIVALVQVPVLIVNSLVQFVVFGDDLAEMLRFSLRPLPVPGGPQSTDPLNGLPVVAYVRIFASSFVLSFIQFIVIHNLTTGALARATARSLVGQPVSIVDAYKIGWRAFLGLIGASLLPYLAAVVAVMVLFGGLFGGILVAIHVDNGGALGLRLAGLLALVVLLIATVGTVVVYLRFLFAPQAIILEGVGPLRGLGRSWQLIGGRFWRSLLVVVLMLLLSYLVAGLPALLINTLISLSFRSVDVLLLGTFATTFVSYIGLILALPLQLCVYTLLYYDLRVRREGYDLELQAQAVLS